MRSVTNGNGFCRPEDRRRRPSAVVVIIICVFAISAVVIITPLVTFLYIRSGQSTAKTPGPPTSPPAYRNADGEQAVRDHRDRSAVADTGDEGPAAAREQEELGTTTADEKDDRRSYADGDMRATRRSLNTAAAGIRAPDDRHAIGSTTMFTSRMQPPPFGVHYNKENRYSNHKNGNHAAVGGGDNNDELDDDHGIRQNVNRYLRSITWSF